MKKIILFITFLVIVSIHSINAQVAWGARLGLCLSTISGEDDALVGKPSLEVGPTLYYSLNNHVYINSGLMLSLKNFEDDFSKESGTGYYLDLPIYAGYAFSAAKTTFYAQAGPFLGLKIADKNLEGLQSFNAGLGTALGVNINRFKIELGYQHGLTNVVEGWDAKISSIFTGISYVF